ncbi:MAG: hypothetical protein KKH94_05850 [Candidatus Omnitrophica bacterium]|nr:hypothetical protein [Candidatus Omnitrophota bacterium]
MPEMWAGHCYVVYDRDGGEETIAKLQKNIGLPKRIWLLSSTWEKRTPCSLNYSMVAKSLVNKYQYRNVRFKNRNNDCYYVELYSNN